MKSLKILGIAGALVASAVVGGTLMSAVSAHPDTSPATSNGTPPVADPAAGEYCQTFLDALAANLGVDVADLTPAARDAAKSTVDAAVANGDLTAAIGEAIKTRIDGADGTGCAWLGMRWQQAVRGAVTRGIGADLLQAAADTLNLEPANLRSMLVDGDSLKQIAADQGVDYATLRSAIHDAAKADLDKVVAAGNMTADREQQILDRLDQALTDGKLFNGNGPMGHHPGRGNGPAAPFGSSAS